MAVNESNVIDFIAQGNDGEVILIISDHLEWDGSLGRLSILQAKLNAYLHFIESGQLHEKYPMAISKPNIVEIRFEYGPDEQGIAFLNRWRTTFQEIGSFLTYQFRQSA